LSGSSEKGGRAALTVGLVALLAGACAKVAPPPGGPEDLDPPTIVVDLGRPAPGSAGFGAADTVRIVFSERPDRRSVMRALRILPNVDFRDVSWEEDTLSLVPDPAWAERRNTLLRISRGARDRRGNPLEHAFLLPFSTKAVADSGVAAGRVWIGRERDDRSPILLFAFDAADSMNPEVAPPHAMAEAGPQGEYRLSGLDTARAYRVLALLDRDDDLAPGGRGEVDAAAPDTIRFTGGNEVTVPDFLLGTLDSTGTIRGEVRADTGAIAIAGARPAADSSGTAAAWSAEPRRGGGAFAIEVPTGAVYRVFAFLDQDGDSAAGAAEPREEWKDEIDLRFTSGAEGIRFDLSTPETLESLELEKGTAAAGGATADSATAGRGVPPPKGADNPEVPK
jgi:hypothetical protein